MFFKRDLLSLREFLKLNAVDELCLYEFDILTDVQKKEKLHSLISEGQVNLIVKLACNNTMFFTLCSHPLFSTKWAELWSTYGVIITLDAKNALFDQPCKDKFKLFLGMFFFYKSIEVRQHLKTEFSMFEQLFLKQAIQYDSIHAIHKYSLYLYQKVESKQKNLFDDLKDNIINIKKLTKDYGCTAYLMLATAYVYSAQYARLFDDLNPSFALRALDAAKNSLDGAKKLYIEDDPLYFNATIDHTNPLKLSEVIINTESLINGFDKKVKRKLEFDEVVDQSTQYRP